MSLCRKVDELAAPYVDGAIGVSDRDAIDAHLRVCAPCHSRIGAERAVWELLRARQLALCRDRAPVALRARCAAASVRRATWRDRAVPAALAAGLVLVVGGAFLYQLTDRSARLLAAELTADHLKCFALNGVVGTTSRPAAIESSMAASFGWHVRLPEDAGRAGLELVGARPCLYGEGRVAHLMYRHNGRPVSVFMLPGATRPDALVGVLGHEAAIWSVGGRTFVVLAREPRAEVQRIASFVHAAFQ